MSTFIYLASQSPRRRELLDQIGVVHRVLKVDLDESRRANEPADIYVQRLAREKAAAGWQYLLDHQLEPALVLGADTAVVIDGDILGKPVDAADAMRILQRLSGRSHEVMTGVAVHSAAGAHASEIHVSEMQASEIHAAEIKVAMSCTRVWFRALERDEIENYWLSGEPRDKAGAYGIQGFAAKFIERIEGSYSGVVGLPLFETSELLRRIEKN